MMGTVSAQSCRPPLIPGANLAISNKKNRLAGLLNGLGIVRAAAWLPRRPQLLVFNYHRIGSMEKNPYDDAVFSASAEGLPRANAVSAEAFRLPSAPRRGRSSDEWFSVEAARPH